MTGFLRFGKRHFYGLDLALYKAIAACIVRATSYVIEPQVLGKLSVGSIFASFLMNGNLL